MHLKNQHSKEMEEKEKEDTGAASSLSPQTHPLAVHVPFQCRRGASSSFAHRLGSHLGLG